MNQPTTIAGLTAAQTAKVEAAGLVAKFRKLATVKRAPAADLLPEIEGMADDEGEIDMDAAAADDDDTPEDLGAGLAGEILIVEAVRGPGRPPKARGPLAHWEAAAEGKARGAIGAHGERKVRPAMKALGNTHRNLGLALAGAGFVAGDVISARDKMRIWQACPLDEAGHAPIKPTSIPSAWFDPAADAGFLKREGGGPGTRSAGFTVDPSVFDALRLQDWADLGLEPSAVMGELDA